MGLAEHAFAGVDECGEDESGGDFRSADQDARGRFHLIPFIGFERRRGQGGRRKGQWAATFAESGLDARECGREGCRFSVQFGKSQEAQRGVEDVGVVCKELIADVGEDAVSDALKGAVRIEGGARRRRQRRERVVAATEVGAIEFRQIIDVGARIGEGAGVDQSALKPNNLSQRSLPVRILADAPAFVVEEADLKNVKVERRVQIVAAGAITGEVFDPGHYAAGQVEVVVDGDGRRVASVLMCDLVFGIEIGKRLVKQEMGRVKLSGGREAAGRRVAIRYIEPEAEIVLKLPEKLAELRVRRRGQRGDDVKWPAALRCAHPFPAGLQAKMDHLPDRVAHRCLVLDRGETAVEVIHQCFGKERVVIGRPVADLYRRPHRFGHACPRWADQCGCIGVAQNKRAGEIEHQRGVFIGACVKPVERGEQFASPHIRVAGQIEGRIGWDEIVCAVRGQQMRRTLSDEVFDAGEWDCLRRRSDVSGSR